MATSEGQTGDSSEGQDSGDQDWGARLFDLLVYLPTGVVVTVAGEVPRVVERGRTRFSVPVGSAKAIGQFVVQAGSDELKRRVSSLATKGQAAATQAAPPGTGTAAGPSSPEERTSSAEGEGGARLRAIPGQPAVRTEEADNSPAEVVSDQPAVSTGGGDGNDPLPPGGRHVPESTSLAIPGFDSLSASQVVQRLDGLDRTELVEVRAYEGASRARRTVLSRIDQLLEQKA